MLHPSLHVAVSVTVLVARPVGHTLTKAVVYTVTVGYGFLYETVLVVTTSWQPGTNGGHLLTVDTTVEYDHEPQSDQSGSIAGVVVGFHVAQVDAAGVFVVEIHDPQLLEAGFTEAVEAVYVGETLNENDGVEILLLVGVDVL